MAEPMVPKIPPPSPPPEPPRQPEGVSIDRTHLIAGFQHAIESFTGPVPAVWRDAAHAARAFAEQIPRLTTARLIVWCREQKVDLPLIAAKVLTDAMAREPGLMEMDPRAAAEEAAALIQSMWPQAAFLPRVTETPVRVPTHPVLDELRRLGVQWHKLAILPIEKARTKHPAQWRMKTLNDIAVAKAKGLQAGLTRDQMLKALEAAGDRWVWEIPPAAQSYYLDEFMQPPPEEGIEAVMSAGPE